MEARRSTAERVGRTRQGSASKADSNRPSIGQLVERRLLSLEYMKGVCAGERHWMSIGIVSLGDGGDDQGLALQWYCLGVSIAPLLQLPSGPAFVKSMLQLLEEFSHYFSSPGGLQKIKSRLHLPRVHGRPDPGDDDVAPKLQRVNGEVVYSLLHAPGVNHALSPHLLLQTSCDVLSQLYRKLLEGSELSHTAPLADAVFKIDAGVESAYLAPAAAFLNGAASVAVKSSLGGADPIFRKMLDPAAYKLDEQDANPAAGGRAHTIPTSGVVSLNI